MAEIPSSSLVFEGICPDCGERRIKPVASLPDVGDDFDWRVRDYDGFRLFMLEELAARFPERRRWTPADMEVVLVEVLAAVLDQLSDTLDRVTAERYLETARRPGSVRRLLDFIGYEAVKLAYARGQIVSDPKLDPSSAASELESFWLRNAHFMNDARHEGPIAIHTQHRMVTEEDYAVRLEEHPLVLRAHSWSHWTGSWASVRLAVVLWENSQLDDVESYPEDIREAVVNFHNERNLPIPDLSAPGTPRTVLLPYVNAYRLLGQEVVLEDAVQVAITMAISIGVAPNFYQSEIRRAVEEALSTDAGGFFEPGRLSFGEDLHASDILEALMALDGVENACLNRFKRLGSHHPDQVATGRIPMDGLELAVCDNNPAEPDRGYYRLTLPGGLKG